MNDGNIKINWQHWVWNLCDSINHGKKERVFCGILATDCKGWGHGRVPTLDQYGIGTTCTQNRCLVPNYNGKIYVRHGLKNSKENNTIEHLQTNYNKFFSSNAEHEKNLWDIPTWEKKHKGLERELTDCGTTPETCNTALGKLNGELKQLKLKHTEIEGAWNGCDSERKKLQKKLTELKQLKELQVQQTEQAQVLKTNDPEKFKQD